MVTFGEQVAYHPLKGSSTRLNKAEARVEMGIWLGLVSRTNEHILGTSKGVVKARAIRRLPKEERWNTDALAMMRGSPWQPVPSKKGDHIPVRDRQ